MFSTYKRKSFKGKGRHHNKKDTAKKKQLKNISTIQKKLDNLVAKRNLKNVKVVSDENSRFCSIIDEYGICLFKAVVSDTNHLSVWDRLYGDRWFNTKGTNGPDLDEAINYFEERRLSKEA